MAELNELPIEAFQLFCKPLALHPAKSSVALATIANRSDCDYGKAERSSRNARLERGYEILSRIAIVSVEGLLVQRLGTLRPANGMTGYDGIRHNFLHALSNPRADAILLDVDSFGGEINGCFDLAETIYCARDRKPIWAVCSETALAAGYAVASAASRVIVPRTGLVGSIGIVAMHIDMSRANEMDGVAYTLIKYGERKTDQSQHAPLSRSARALLQADVDEVGKMFNDLVARNRSIRASKVEAFQAATFMGARGVRAGLADAVVPPDRAFLALSEAITQRRRVKK